MLVSNALPLLPARMLSPAEPEEEVEESNAGAEAEQPEAREGAELSQAKPQVARRRVPSHLAESYSSEPLPVCLPAACSALPTCPPSLPACSACRPVRPAGAS